MKKLLREVAGAFEAAKSEGVTKRQVFLVGETMYGAGVLQGLVLSVLLYFLASTWPVFLATVAKLTVTDWLVVVLVIPVCTYLCEVFIFRKIIGSGGGSSGHGSVE